MGTSASPCAEEYRKPTNPFERLKVAKDPMKETVHLAGLEEMAAASAADFKAWDEAVGADEAGAYTRPLCQLNLSRFGHTSLCSPV